MLGRLGMSVTEAIASYETLAGRVFSDVKRFGEGKFKARKLEEIIKEVVRDRTRQEDACMLDNRPEGNGCKT